MMTVRARLEALVASRHLLDHPFYQRWTAGTLTRGELQEYARQYWHFTAAFPRFVSGVHAQTDELTVRQELLENLIEEERGSENHPELWLRFCEALGVSRVEAMGSEATESTRNLIATMRSLTSAGATHEGLASLFAYESQVPAVAKAKIAGLAANYAISDARDVAFFSVHEHADVVHAATAISILERVCKSEGECDEACASALETLGALYGFLDGVTARAAVAVS